MKKEPETKKSKGGAIDSMFGKQKEKESAKSEADKTTTTTTSTSKTAAATSKAPAAKKNTGIAGLFAKQAAAGPVPKKPVKQESEPEDENLPERQKR